MQRLQMALISGIMLMSACKKKAPVAAEAPTGSLSVEQSLQAVMLTPDAVDAQQARPAQLVGTGFQPGALVQVGDVSVSDVSVEDSYSARFTLPALPDGRYDLTIQNPDGSSATLWSALLVGGAGGAVAGYDDSCRNVVVYYELNADELEADGRQVLNREVTCWQSGDGVIRVAGHADERGTTDYNLALGQRRADAVRSHLSRAGLPLHRMTTTSYGEENPADKSASEQAWAANRRVEVTAD